MSRTSRLCLKELEPQLGKQVSLSGWVSFVRKAKEVTFVGLRDGENHPDLLQIVVPNNQVDGLKLEDVVSVSGVLEQRPKGFEIKPTTLVVENRCQHPLPLNIKLATNEVQTPQQRDNSLRYRYLDLRIRPHLQRNLHIRGTAALAMRNLLTETEGFLEVETPTLFKSTPEGAREFLVPVASESIPKFYALVQSPQQYKQMLMVGGIDRYFQFARCYRDEGGRADRQPEFTQLDMEMAFVNQCEHVQLAVEKVVCAGWIAAYNKYPQVVPLPPQLNQRFYEIPLERALQEYGSDKPNLSFGMKIESGKQITAMGLAVSLSKKEKSDLIRQVTTLAGVLVKDVDFTQTGHVVVNALELNKLGKARLVLHEWMLYKQIPISPGELPLHEPFWVTDFNLFECDENGMISSTHHPFTSPHPDDLSKLQQVLEDIRNGRDPDKIRLTKLRALHYDLVCDGVELGGGSIRIHNSKLQEQVLRDALGISQQDCRLQFSHLLDALALGAPPHGGFALGFDRFVSMLCGAGSLSDTLAFPKSSTGTDPLTGAPCVLTETQSNVLQRLALRGV
ncbi:hypothetical protein BASA81_005485 [Batrachochytrium salamandrivorans]|nr:hypothetical protein BASA81_005485 [Batrachochytrium salamandrivorans]